MLSRLRILSIVALTAHIVAAAPVGLMAQTVTLSLSSPENGASVAPGATINWSINFTVSPGDNAGLALLSVDLAQAAANPAKFDIPPASAVPAAMANFSRPAGISNPGEINPTTGYIGVQRGAMGEKNLKQIGGAQNTFGQARPPGSGIAENANVTGGVGQSGSVTLASGSFTAPSVDGTYTFQIENAIANVMSAVNAPPAFSPVVSAGATLAAPSFSFTVAGVPCNACDVNCDGQNNGNDIATFVNLLLTASPPGCSPCAGDMDLSGTVTDADIAPLVTCLLAA